MKKFALILLMIIVTLSSLFAFTACDKDKGTANGKTVSSHTYPYTYKYESNRITVTEHDGSKKIYEYHKNQSIMLNDSRIF